VIGVVGLVVGIAVPQVLLGLSILAASYNVGHSLLSLWGVERQTRPRRVRRIGPTSG
jgi:hypothetical protein